MLRILTAATRRDTSTQFLKRFMSITSNNAAADFPVQASITTKLMEALEPSVLRVVNESHMHNVPKNAETHFKVVVVSSKFDDVKGLGRHRIVNSILAKEIATEGPVHALSIVAKTPAQWEEGNVVIDKSPSCRGGDGSLPSK